MREEMISSFDFCGAIFIGGMEGIFEESKIFRKFHKECPQIAIGSTGGAAEMLLDETRGTWDDKTYNILLNERRYRRIFRLLIPPS